MDDEPSDADLKAAEPPTIVKLAAAVQGVTGLFVALSGLQCVGLRWNPSYLAAFPYLLLVFGGLQIALAALYYRARPFAAFGGAGLGALVALTTVTWFIVTFLQVMSCMVVVSIPLSVVSAILAALGVPGVRATAAARQRLADQGFSLGL